MQGLLREDLAIKSLHVKKKECQVSYFSVKFGEEMITKKKQNIIIGIKNSNKAYAFNNYSTFNSESLQ